MTEKEKTIIEQARENVTNKHAELFTSDTSNPRMLQNHLMEEALRLCIKEIRDRCDGRFEQEILDDIEKIEGIEQ